MRYLSESLPILVTFVVFALTRLPVKARDFRLLIPVAAAALAAMAWAYPAQEFWVVRTGGYVALGLLAAAALVAWRRLPRWVFLAPLAVSVAWGAHLNFYDMYYRERASRDYGRHIRHAATQLIEPPAALISWGPNAWRFTQLKSDHDVWVGDVQIDHYKNRYVEVFRDALKLRHDFPARRLYVDVPQSQPHWELIVNRNILPCFETATHMWPIDEARTLKLHELVRHRQMTPEGFTIDIGTYCDEAFVLSGMHGREKSGAETTYRWTETEAALAVGDFLLPAGDSVSVQIDSFGRRPTDTVVIVRFNDAEIGRFVSGRDATSAVFTFDRGFVRPGWGNTLTLTAESPVSPTGDNRELGFALADIRFAAATGGTP
jgi:hypothetical protein